MSSYDLWMRVLFGGKDVVVGKPVKPETANHRPVVRTSRGELLSMHDEAARKANETGQPVECNGVTYVPNKEASWKFIDALPIYIIFGICGLLVFISLAVGIKMLFLSFIP